MAITNINQLSPELQQAASSLTTPVSAPVPAPQQDIGQQDLQNPTEALPLAQPNPSSATPLTPALPNFAPGTFQSKLKAAADQLGIPPGPGGWAKSLVGAAQSALGGIETGLGDVAAAKTEPGNRGILGGIGAVQNARAARQQEQRKALTEDQLQQAQIGKINLDTHYQQLMLHKLEGDINDKANNDAIQNGKLAINLATSLRTAAGQNSADTIASDISEDQLQRALTDKGPDGKPTWDPNTSTAWETSSYQPIDPKTMKPQVDADGQPVQKKLYTIIKTPETITLNKDAADLLNENLKPKTPFVEGQSLPGAVGLGQIQQAQNAQALSAKVESDRKKAELDELTSDQQLAKAQASKNLGSDFFHIAAQAGSLQQTMDFITGQHKIDVPVMGPDGKPTGQTTKQIDPRSADFAAKHPTAAEDYMNLNGGYVDYTKMRDAETEKLKNAMSEPLDKIEKDLPEMAPDKLPATTAFLEQALKSTNPNIDKPRVTNLLVQAREAQHQVEANKRKEEEDKNDLGTTPTSRVALTPELQGQINALPGPQKSILSQYDPNSQAALMKIAFGNGEVDLEKNFPARLTKGAPGLNTQQALGVLSQLNPNWSEQTYDVKHGMYKDATTGKLSEQADSLNNFIGHAAEGKRITDTLFNSDPKLFKSTVNLLSTMGYGTSAVSLGEALDVVNSEFNTMIKSGYAPTQDEIAAQKALVSKDATVGQIDAALKVMSHMGTTRATTMDNHYKNATGDHFPNLINPENQEDARYLGIPVERFYTGGRIAGSGNGPQMRSTQTGKPGTGVAPQTPPPAQPADFFGQFGGKKRGE